MAKKLEEAANKAGWLLGISGLLMLMFGIMLLLTPTITLETAVLFIGAVLAVAGILKLCESLLAPKGANYAGNLAMDGAFSLVVGIIMLFGSKFIIGGTIMVFGALAVLLALIALVAGVGHIVHAMKVKRGRMLGLAAGVIFLLLGIVVIANPFSAAIAMLSAFMVVYGLLLVVLAVNIKVLFG